MSWMFIKYNLHSQIEPAVKPIHRISGKNFDIFLGGNRRTCVSVGNEQNGFAVCGLGIDDWHIWNENDWQKAIEKNETPSDGHFIIVQWGNDEIKFQNDVLGLRDLFWAKYGDGFIISTRMDWVMDFARKNEIDFTKLGSLWLGPSILHWDSFIKDIYRLGPGGTVKFTNSNFAHLGNKYFSRPHSQESSLDDVIDILLSAVSTEPEIPKYLSLSGGLDSRALLAFLYGTSIRWRTFSFGIGDEPDIQIVEKMSDELGFSFEFHRVEIPREDELWDILLDHSRRKMITIPISTALFLHSLNFLENLNVITIDGGLGEILRQRVLRRLAPVPNMKLTPKLVRKLIGSELPPIFNEDVRRLLERGFIADIENALERCSGMRADEIAEMWAIWFRLPNYSGFEQARLDEFTQNFMPFVQPTVMNAALRLSNKQRRKSAVHLRAIERFAPKLAKYKLSRFGRKLPFKIGVNPYLMRMYLPFSRDMQTPIMNTFFRKMMNKLQERILDILASQSFNSAGFYDHKFVKDSVDKYFAGDDSKKSTLDWWLTTALFLAGQQK